MLYDTVIIMNKRLLAPALFCLLFAACSTPVPQDDVLEVKAYNQIMKSGTDVPDPVHGKEVKFYYGAVAGTDGTNANGIAYVHMYDDGTSVVTVNLNIALPDSGNYVAYLQDSSGEKIVTVGKLQSIVGDVRHTVKGETKEDVTKTLTVQVRLESRAKKMLVAEGTLKEPVSKQ